MSRTERAKPLRQKKIIYYTLTWHKTCGFPTTTSSAWARVIATLNLLGLLRKPTVWRTSTPTNDSLERTCNQSQHSRQSGLIHFKTTCCRFSIHQHLCILNNAACGARWFDRKCWWFTLKTHTFQNVFHSDDIENLKMESYQRGTEKTEHCQLYNVDERRKHMKEQAHKLKQCDVDGPLNLKYTTVWSKSRFWHLNKVPFIFKKALEEFLVHVIQHPSELKWKHASEHALRKNGVTNQQRPEKILRCCLQLENV